MSVVFEQSIAALSGPAILFLSDVDVDGPI